jgi:hypothetical protein
MTDEGYEYADMIAVPSSNMRLKVHTPAIQGAGALQPNATILQYGNRMT